MRPELLSIQVIDQFRNVRNVEVTPLSKIGCLQQYFADEVHFYFHGIKLDNEHSFAHYGFERCDVVIVINPKLTEEDIQEEIRFQKNYFNQLLRAANFNPKLYNRLIAHFKALKKAEIFPDNPDDTIIPTPLDSPSIEPLPFFE